MNMASRSKQVRLKKVTLNQYEALPENQTIEVFNGLISYMANPSPLHHALVTELSNTFYTYIRNKNTDWQLFNTPFDAKYVKLSCRPLIIVHPDLMLICDTKKLDGKICNGAPDFIIEVVSPSDLADDYIHKLYYYKIYGVREYWIVDIRRKTVTVNYFVNNLLNVQYSFDSVIKVNIFDDFYIDFCKITESMQLE